MAQVFPHQWVGILALRDAYSVLSAIAHSQVICSDCYSSEMERDRVLKKGGFVVTDTL
jgi:hypothetical protein